VKVAAADEPVGNARPRAAASSLNASSRAAPATVLSAPARCAMRRCPSAWRCASARRTPSAWSDRRTPRDRSRSLTSTPTSGTSRLELAHETIVRVDADEDGRVDAVLEADVVRR
jgi:hypothetical protein